MLHILVLVKTNEAHRRQLREAAPEARFCWHDETPDEEFLSRVEVVLGNPSAALLQKLPGVKLVQLESAGVPPHVRSLPQSIALTNASGAFGPAIAEHSLGVVLALMKKLHLYRDHQSRGLWANRGMVGCLSGSRVLVVGLGDLGLCFARMVHALGCSVTGIKRTSCAPMEGVDAVYTLEDLDAQLPQADIVFLSLPDTPATSGLFGRERIGRMKRGAMLINVGRGSAVDLEALCDAVEGGALSGAGLDVTAPEPLPENHRAWKVENLFITPHVSGGLYMQATHDRVITICEENLRRFRSGHPLSNIVNRAEGY